uniref:Phosphatidylinositol-4-phosphate 5-kinase 5 n=1 Tax=Magallana gigas TaxID=29159 RepID=K1Q0T3_MAGGI
MEGEYTGHVKEGKMHGVGICEYTDGSRYQGDWKAGLKNGSGTHSFASGDQYEGEWENGWMHGLGVYTWKIGDKYIGEVRWRLQYAPTADVHCIPLARASATTVRSFDDLLPR